MSDTLNLAQAMKRAASNVRTNLVWAGRFVTGTGRVRACVAAEAHLLPAVSVPGGRSEALARVEAALFAAGEPVGSRKLATVAGLADAAQARALVEQLQSYYEADATAFTIENVAGGWQLRTRRELASWLDKLQERDPSLRLSQAALETLSIVAYRQPILRADVEAIRGVAAGELLRHLIERGLVRTVGHHDSLGRPLLYGTTRKFLELFGLSNLEQLPLLSELRPPPPHLTQTAPIEPEHTEEDGDRS